MFARLIAWWRRPKPPKIWVVMDQWNEVIFKVESYCTPPSPPFPGYVVNVHSELEAEELVLTLTKQVKERGWRWVPRHQSNSP